MKSAVYSWRVSTDLKIGLEREPHRRKISVSAALDLADRDGLHKGGAEIEGDEEQLRLQKAASKCLGVLAGGIARRTHAKPCVNVCDGRMAADALIDTGAILGT